MTSDESKYNQGFIEAKEKLAKLGRGKKSVSSGHNRLPPGQRLTQAFPVLDLGVRPDFDPDTWRLTVSGAVAKPRQFTYQELLALPPTSLTADFHCVTRWSKFDVKWRGVGFVEFCEVVQPKPEARFVVASCADGYTANLVLDELKADNVILAYELEGKPLPREHGWPIRLVVPHLYGWKSVKFLKGLEFLAEDKPGFWEVRGYHNHADPWQEERYS